MSIRKTPQRWGKLLLFASFSAIFVATIAPFNFEIPSELSEYLIADEFGFGSTVRDYGQNILLFIPLGIGLAIISDHRQLNILTIAVVTGVISTTVSSTIEIIQFFLPSRVSNLSDILCNGLGGIMGGIFYCWRSDIAKLLIDLSSKDSRNSNVSSLLVAIASYCSVVTVVILTLLTNVNLSNWHDDFYLTIGNEATGNRPWNGHISDLYISDRGLKPLEATEVFQLASAFFAQSQDLVTFLRLPDGQNYYQDRSQHIPTLLWQDLPTPYQTSLYPQALQVQTAADAGVLVNSTRWLRTPQAATYLNRKLRKAGEFSLYFTVVSNNPKQFGPARIMALSKGIYAQNMVIGQKGSDLSFRLATPITGNDATQPEFIVPKVFNNHDHQQILITFANQKLDFYVNNSETKYSFEFTPATSFFMCLSRQKKNWVINLEQFKAIKYKLLFYMLIIAPLYILATSLFCNSIRE